MQIRLFTLLLTCVLPTGLAKAGNLKWSDHTWDIRNDTGGPGPNTFSKDNVSVANDGTLHVQILNHDNHWTCAELNTTEPLGYGTYQFSILSRIDQLDRNVVLGLFSYPTADVGPDGTNELDIEFARWGKEKNPNGNYTVWPVKEHAHTSDSTFEFTLKSAESTHRYTWTKGSVLFESLNGIPGMADNPIAHWSTPPSYAKQVSRSPMPLHINLWLFHGKPPTDGKPVEIVLKDFVFIKAGK
jgi:hypothetical protein